MASGIDGLASQSRRQKNSPAQKLKGELRQKILSLRTTRNLGARRIQSELLRHESISLALATIHKVLTDASVKPIVKLKRKKKFKRYQRPIPGDRVQADTCKITPGIREDIKSGPIFIA